MKKETQPKKALGQHWLQDETILDSIVDSAQLVYKDTVLEIGPGQGTLTDRLLLRNVNLAALEFDRDLIGGLLAKYSNNDSINIIHGDIRTFNFSKLPKNYKIVANIPYYLTSHLIRSISETINPPLIAVLLMQKEVAQRVCAKPGKMGILSVSAQYYFDCQLGIEVAAKYFKPKPKVDSQVIILTKRVKPLFIVDEKKFFRLIKIGFSEKRKTLCNTMSSGFNESKDDINLLLNKVKLSPTCRAQELSLNQWFELYQQYYFSS